MKKLITIDEFLNDISDTSNLYVDVNSLCNISGATPTYNETYNEFTTK